MEPTRPQPLVLPPALTYLIARAFDAERVRRRGPGVPTTRLEGLLRDSVRYLVASGATLADVQAAVHDVCEVADAWRADPTLRVALAELEASAHAFAATVTTRPAITGDGEAVAPVHVPESRPGPGSAAAR